MKVGLVGPLPPPAGGMARQTYQLSQLLCADGVEVQLVQTNGDYRPAFIAKLKGVRALVRLLEYGVNIWRLAGKVDVIHLMANSGWSWQLFAAPVLWLASLRNTPVIVNYRGGEAREYFLRSFSRVRPSLAKASKVVVPSGFLNDVFSEFSVDTQVIPNIINLERFKPTELRDTETHHHVIITRNLESLYGIDTAIRAIAIAKESIPELELSIAGTGPQQQQLENLVKQLGLMDAVSFVGRLEPDEMAALYQSAGLMLNPSNVDNMPNSILESMASGVPVLSTNVGGIPYMVQHNETAVLVDPKEPTQMAEQIVLLHQDSDRYKAIVKNGIANVKQYAWSEVRSQWMAAYSDAISSAAHSEGRV